MLGHIILQISSFTFLSRCSKYITANEPVLKCNHCYNKASLYTSKLPQSAIDTKQIICFFQWSSLGVKYCSQALILWTEPQLTLYTKQRPTWRRLMEENLRYWWMGPLIAYPLPDVTAELTSCHLPIEMQAQQMHTIVTGQALCPGEVLDMYSHRYLLWGTCYEAWSRSCVTMNSSSAESWSEEEKLHRRRKSQARFLRYSPHSWWLDIPLNDL